MKIWMAVFLIVIMLSGGMKAEAESKVDWTSLNEISHEAFHLAKEQHFEEALQLITYFGKQFKKLNMDTAKISYQQLRIIAAVHEKAVEKLENKSTPEEKIKAVTQFRLLTDALFSENEPLWGSMESPIMTTFSGVKAELEKGSHKAFIEDWNKFLSLYDIIYPSITIDLDPQKVKNVDKDISIIKNAQFESYSEETRNKRLVVMENDLKALFERVKDDEADPSLIWVIISTGSVILLSLSYTGWRKFKGEREQKNERDTNK
ncbi:sporulation protein YpjB [Metabacillus sp. RGM 3146]|uniref:sporulation protein YpjB n=1 Tax=Metabacillus sp. RGM 3146 TaxID=3401092 RepID=UPI003B9C374A